MAKQRIPVFRKDQKLKFLDPQRQIEVESSNFAMDWWREEGVYIDPDTEDVDWHDKRGEFLLDAAREPLHVVDGLEIYEGPGNRIFYRGIAVQTPDKAALFTYNITSHLYLTEDRTAGSWATDPVIARGLTHLKDKSIIEATLTAPANTLESRLDYDYAHNPGDAWRHIAEHVVAARPMAVPNSVSSSFRPCRPRQPCLRRRRSHRRTIRNRRPSSPALSRASNLRSP